MTDTTGPGWLKRDLQSAQREKIAIRAAAMAAQSDHPEIKATMETLIRLTGARLPDRSE